MANVSAEASQPPQRHRPAATSRLDGRVRQRGDCRGLRSLDGQDRAQTHRGQPVLRRRGVQQRGGCVLEGYHREARAGRRGLHRDVTTDHLRPHHRRRDRARHPGQLQPRRQAQGHQGDERHTHAPETPHRKRRGRSDAHRGRKHRGHDREARAGTPAERPEPRAQRREVCRVRAGLCQPDGGHRACLGADARVSPHRLGSIRALRR